ncbi:MAG: hypothetical protein FJW92_07315 [Actinobacteria bacterium]|nr:hypothetical protein [Actinomycetota bacterium]
MNQRGSTTAEYIGIVIVLVLLFIGLLAVRSTSLGRRAPVRPLPAIITLIEPPPRPIVRPALARPDRPRAPRRPRPPRPAPPGVMLPSWIGPP